MPDIDIFGALGDAFEEKLWESVPRLAIEDYEKITREVKGMSEKVAYSTALRRAGELLNYFPGKYPGGIPNAPSPLAAMLTHGLVGAGLGYGAGVIGEHVLPQRWRKGNLRNTLAIAGGAIGAAPGALWAATNIARDKSFNDGTLFNGPTPMNSAPFKGIHTHPDVMGVGETKLDDNDEIYQIVPEGASEPKLACSEEFLKLADDYSTGANSSLPVNVNAFNQTIWEDPRVANQVPIGTRAAVSGLLTGASYLAQSPIVTPTDIGRMTVGMGTGYLSGALVGKALGVMLGMPEETQDTMKNVGMWAGVVRALAPLAFGG